LLDQGISIFHNSRTHTADQTCDVMTQRLGGNGTHFLLLYICKRFTADTEVKQAVTSWFKTLEIYLIHTWMSWCHGGGHVVLACTVCLVHIAVGMEFSTICVCAAFLF